MNRDDQLKIMECLKPEELILGLSIFNQEALIKLMQQLPPETLALPPETVPLRRFITPLLYI